MCNTADLHMNVFDDSVLSELNWDPVGYLYVGPLSHSHVPTIKRVMYNDLTTIVEWDDDSKTVVRCYKEDAFDKEAGLAMAIARKYFEFNGQNENPRAEFKHCVENATVYSEPKIEVDENYLFKISQEILQKALSKFNNGVKDDE